MAIPKISSNIVAPSTFQVRTPSKPKRIAQPAAAADTVKISSAAKVLQKTTAAPAEVVQAAAGGDLQAKAQLAKPAPVASASSK